MQYKRPIVGAFCFDCRKISDICNTHKCGGSVEKMCRQRFSAIWNKSLVICSQ
nr:MAG TPA: hypothetical protein [Caudoviricetes sp.]